MKKESVLYGGKPLPPAIPDQSPVCETRFFELSETVTVFDDLDRQLMRKVCNHYPLSSLEGQMMIGGVLDASS